LEKGDLPPLGVDAMRALKRQEGTPQAVAADRAAVDDITHAGRADAAVE
jgi:hypothetical protein